jgi:signal transduction histidine kinase
MYKRLIPVSIIILLALCGLAALGYHSIRIWSQGLQGSRLGEFAAVAEQIQLDVKRKLDDFLLAEQQRPYTHYQYYYIPENIAENQLQQQVQQAVPSLRSPLAEKLENNFAYGYFQIQPDGSIVTPYDRDLALQTESKEVRDNDFIAQAQYHYQNIDDNLLPAITSPSGILQPQKPQSLLAREIKKKPDSLESTSQIGIYDRDDRLEQVQEKQNVQQPEAQTTQKSSSTSTRSRKESYPVGSLLSQPQQDQFMQKTRRSVEQNVVLNEPAPQQQDNEVPRQTMANLFQQRLNTEQQTQQQDDEEIVQIRISPFWPILTGGINTEKSLLGNQVFLVRSVQYDNNLFYQGFQINEIRLAEEVKESAVRLMREGMDFELSRTENGGTAYTAILDFGFGNFILNLIETDTSWIPKRISWMKKWFFSIIILVFFASALGLASLWRYAHAQMVLAQKKDDFISAVSHELRTPLTSIRMYTEMLDKDWIKSEDKRTEYYKNMLDESERLSRLIENVLDFSRIQKKRKKYTFTTGDLNKCVYEVVKMMRPYAHQNGFTIQADFKAALLTTFDRDAIKQITVNLLDNAIKYARSAEDKTIAVRTYTDGRYILIEVEDHGPGIPHLQRKKVFEQFYRCEAEATRETPGTGLGLALVKKFAQAHNGFVEIISSKPTGSIFRVAIASKINA